MILTFLGAKSAGVGGFSSNFFVLQLLSTPVHNYDQINTENAIMNQGTRS